MLGLVSTKTARLEDRDLLIQRLRQAQRFLPIERLAISTQCGFATSILGNQISPADQKRKLALVVETARSVWG